MTYICIICYLCIIPVINALALEDQIALWSQDPSRRLPLETLTAWRVRRPAVVARCMAGACSFQVVAASVNDTKDLNAEEVWSAMLCLKHDVACPIQGGWSNWSGWSACTARCGAGAAVRARSCSRPPPSRAALTCSGACIERHSCRGVACAAVTDGAWLDWSAWSACTAHVRRRARSCSSDEPQATLSACSGERVQVEECKGGSDVAGPSWSCWSSWSSCSAACGRGMRARVRGCTRATCLGRHDDRAPCYPRPCVSYAHQVVAFNGQAEMMFTAAGSEARNLHIYVRFLPFSPIGTLMALKDPECEDTCPAVTIFLSSGQVILDWAFVAVLNAEQPLELARWHEVLVSVSTSEATMRIDGEDRLHSTNIVYNKQVNFDRRVVVGSNFNGQISNVVINFEQLMMSPDKNEGASRKPYFVTNIGYEKANIEEGFQSTAGGFLLRIPCFKDPAQWSIDMSLQPNSGEGLIVYMQNPSVDNWLNVSLQNSRVLLTVGSEDVISEKISDIDLEAKSWMELILRKNKGSNAIEMTVNGGNPMILILSDVDGNFGAKQTPSLGGAGLEYNDAMYSMCEGEMYVGGVPHHSQVLSITNDSEVKPLSATIGHMGIDGEFLDLSALSKEKSSGSNYSTVYLSSRTASSARLYRSTPLAPGSWVQLSCFVPRVGDQGRGNVTRVRWYKLDVPVLEDELFSFKSKGRYLELKINTSSFRNRVEGFFTCRDERRGVIGQRNMVTYGVWTPHRRVHWDPRWALSAAVAVLLASTTVLWLLSEAIQDFVKGHGLFRDKVLTKKDEAKEMIRFLELNQVLVGTRSAVRLARARIRRRAGLHLNSSIQFAAERESFLRVIKDNGTEFDSDEEVAESIACKSLQTKNANMNLPGDGVKSIDSESKRIGLDKPSGSQRSARKVMDMFKLNSRRG